MHLERGSVCVAEAQQRSPHQVSLYEDSVCPRRPSFNCRRRQELNIELLTATLCSADFASKSFLCHCLGWSIVEMTRCIDRLEIFSRTEKHEHYSDVRTTFVLVPQTLAARQESNVSGKIGDRYDKILTDYLVDPD